MCVPSILGFRYPERETESRRKLDFIRRSDVRVEGTSVLSYLYFAGSTRRSLSTTE